MLCVFAILALVAGACASEASMTGSAFQPDLRNDPIDHLEIDLEPHVDLESVSLEAEGGSLTVAWNVHGPIPPALPSGEQSLLYVLSLTTFDEEMERVRHRYAVRVSLTPPGHPYGEGWTGRLARVDSEDRTRRELPQPVAAGRVVRVEIPSEDLDGIDDEFLWKATSGVGGGQDQVPDDLMMNGWEARRLARFPGTDTLGRLGRLLGQ